MSEIVIRIRTNNDAFQDGHANMEVANILREHAERIDDWSGDTDDWTNNAISILDSNGNRVGQLKVHHGSEVMR